MQHLIWIIIAIVGGIAGYLDRFLHQEEILSIARIFSTIVITGFTGYMTANVMMLIYPQWALISAGVGGYAGTKMMDTVVEFIRFKMNVPEKKSTPTKKPNDKR